MPLYKILVPDPYSTVADAIRLGLRALGWRECQVSDVRHMSALVVTSDWIATHDQPQDTILITASSAPAKTQRSPWLLVVPVVRLPPSPVDGRRMVSYDAIINTITEYFTWRAAAVAGTAESKEACKRRLHAARMRRYYHKKRGLVE